MRFFRRKQNEPERPKTPQMVVPQPQASLPPNDIDNLDLSDTVRVSTIGIPKALSPDQRTQVMKNLMRVGLEQSERRVFQPGEVLHQGTAQIRVGNTTHNITFRILALRVMTAMEVLGAAYQEVKEGVEQGKYDPVLGANAAKFFKDEAREEFRKLFPDDRAEPKTHQLNPQPPQEREPKLSERRNPDDNNSNEDRQGH